MKQHAALQKARGNSDPRSEEIAERDDVLASNNVALVGSDQELAQLNLRLGDLKASLEKAQRRIERLLGERNQLGALLDKRDEQIQQLNRELGPRRFAGTDEASIQTAPSFWRELLPSLARKILAKSETAQPGVDLLSAAERDKEEAKAPIIAGFRRPPLVANYKKSEPQAVLAVALFGLDENEIKNLLPVIERDCVMSNMMPLLLTDNDAFELLRERGMIFEYLPPAEDRLRFSRMLSWDLYVQRRLAIIRQKWQPTRVIALGQVATDMLRLWHESPFEEIPLPAVMKT